MFRPSEKESEEQGITDAAAFPVKSLVITMTEGVRRVALERSNFSLETWKC